MLLYCVVLLCISVCSILFFYLGVILLIFVFFFFSSRRRHTRCLSDWSSDVCSSDLWMPATGNAAKDELLVKRIRSAVDAQLQAKGRAASAGNPDFLIAMQLSGRTAYGGSAAVGVSVGIPVGRAGRVSVGGARSKPIEKKEGTLVLDFLDAKTKPLLWRATASGAVEANPTPDEQQKRINAVIAEMLAYFPPKK